jgi:hypothetical protein
LLRTTFEAVGNMRESYFNLLKSRVPTKLLTQP